MRSKTTSTPGPYYRAVEMGCVLTNFRNPILSQEILDAQSNISVIISIQKSEFIERNKK